LDQGLHAPVIRQLAEAIERRCKLLAKYYGSETSKVAA